MNVFNEKKDRGEDAQSFTRSEGVSSGRTSAEKRIQYADMQSLSSAISSQKSRDSGGEKLSFVSSKSARTQIPKQQTKLTSCISFSSKSFMFPREERLAREERYRQRGYLYPDKKRKLTFDTMSKWHVYKSDIPHYLPYEEWTSHDLMYLPTQASFKKFINDETQIIYYRNLYDRSEAVEVWKDIVKQNAEKKKSEDAASEVTSSPKITGTSSSFYEKKADVNERVIELAIGQFKQGIAKGDEIRNGIDLLIDTILADNYDPSVQKFLMNSKTMEVLESFVKLCSICKQLQKNRFLKRMRWISTNKIFLKTNRGGNSPVMDRALAQWSTQLHGFLDQGTRLLEHAERDGLYEFMDSLAAIDDKLAVNWRGRILCAVESPAAMPTLQSSTTEHYTDFFEPTLKFEKTAPDPQHRGSQSMWRLLPKEGKPVSTSPPRATLSASFQHAGSFLINPKQAWFHFKLMFAEHYFNALNSSYVSAVINNNADLLRHCSNEKPPKVIADASLMMKAFRQPFELKGVRTSTMTQNHGYRLVQKASEFGTSPLDLKRLLRKRQKEGKPKPAFPAKSEVAKALRAADVTLPPILDADSLSGALSPAIRADIFYSKRRGSCHGSCRGHRGKLLLTAINQGHHEMVQLLLKGGVSVNASPCSLRAKRLNWTMDPQRIAELRKQQAEKAKNTKEPKGNSKSALKQPKLENIRPIVPAKSKPSSSGSNEEDLYRALDDHYGTYISKFERTTPLAAAVEKISMSPCPNAARTINPLMSRRALKIEKADFAALRACIPVLDTLAQASLAQAKKDKQIRKETATTNSRFRFLRLEFWLNLRLLKTLLQAGSVKKNKAKQLEDKEAREEKLLKAKPLSANGALTQRQQDLLIAFQSSQKSLNEKAKEGGKVYEDLQTLKVIIAKTESHLNTDKKTARKHKGAFARIYIKTLLVHEALFLSHWDVVRFLIPKSEKTLLGPSKYRLHSEDACFDAPFDRRSVEIERNDSLVLLYVIDTLLLGFMKESSYSRPNFSPFLKSIYFLLQEYNVTLDADQWEKLMESIRKILVANIRLFAGDKEAIEKLTSLPQFLHAFDVEKYKFFDRRVVKSMASGTKFFNSRSKKAKLDKKLIQLPGLAVSVGLDDLFEVLVSKVQNAYDKETFTKYLHSTFKRSIISRKRVEAYSVLHPHLEEDGADRAFFRTFLVELTNQGLKSNQMEISEMFLYFLNRGLDPSLAAMGNQILAMCMYPCLGTEDEYKHNLMFDSSQSLANFSVMRKLIEKLTKLGRNQLIKIFEKIFEALAKVREEGNKKAQDLWLYGIQEILNFVDANIRPLEGASPQLAHALGTWSTELAQYKTLDFGEFEHNKDFVIVQSDYTDTMSDMETVEELNRGFYVSVDVDMLPTPPQASVPDDIGVGNRKNLSEML